MTVDQNTRQIHKGGLPECVVSTMSGPPPETAQDRTQTKDTHTQSQDSPPGIEPGPPGWKARTLPTTPRRRISHIFGEINTIACESTALKNTTIFRWSFYNMFKLMFV